MDADSVLEAYAYEFSHHHWRSVAVSAWAYDSGRPMKAFIGETNVHFDNFWSEWNKAAKDYLARVNEAAGPLIRIQKVCSAANEKGKRAKEEVVAAEKREREALTKEFKREARKLAEAERKVEENMVAVKSKALNKGSIEGREKLVGEDSRDGGSNGLTKTVSKEVASQTLEEQGSSLGVHKIRQNKAVAQKGALIVPTEEARSSENQGEGKQTPGRMDRRQESGESVKVSFLSAND